MRNRDQFLRIMLFIRPSRKTRRERQNITQVKDHKCLCRINADDKSNYSAFKLHLITGNHDIWIFDYLPEEIDLQVHRQSITRTWNKHLFYLGHGDGLYHGDRKYMMLPAIFKNRTIQWFYARIHSFRPPLVQKEP